MWIGLGDEVVPLCACTVGECWEKAVANDAGDVLTS